MMMKLSRTLVSKPTQELNGLLARSLCISMPRPKQYPRPLRTKKHGIDVVHDPLWNKNLAFDLSERDRLGLRGLMPPKVQTMKAQIARSIEHIRSLPDDVSKNLYLQEMLNTNETQYHRILIEYVSKFKHLRCSLLLTGALID